MSIHIGYGNLRVSAAMNTADKNLRLKQAREAAGYKSPADAADAMGVPRPSYYHHENGNRDFSNEDAVRYAKKFKVRPEWLVFNVDGESHLKTSNSIREVDARAGAGGGGLGELIVQTPSHGYTVQQDAVRDVWQIPDSFLRGVLRIDSAGAWIIEVYGDSGYNPAQPHAPGSIFPGDRVIVDTNDRRPSPPGPFLVFDGTGLVVKLVDIVPQSDPVRIRMSSRNEAYPPYEATVDEAHVIGRVRGKITVM